MKFTYDPKYNIAYICFRDKTESVDTINISENVKIDITADGTIYGIELLNARDQLDPSKHGILELVNEASGETVSIKIAG